MDRVDRMDRMDRMDRVDRVDRMDRMDRMDRVDRVDPGLFREEIGKVLCFISNNAAAGWLIFLPSPARGRYFLVSSRKYPKRRLGGRRRSKASPV